MKKVKCYICHEDCGKAWYELRTTVKMADKFCARKITSAKRDICRACYDKYVVREEPLPERD